MADKTRRIFDDDDSPRKVTFPWRRTFQMLSLIHISEPTRPY